MEMMRKVTANRETRQEERGNEKEKEKRDDSGVKMDVPDFDGCANEDNYLKWEEWI